MNQAVTEKVFIDSHAQPLFLVWVRLWRRRWRQAQQIQQERPQWWALLWRDRHARGRSSRILRC